MNIEIIEEQVTALNSQGQGICSHQNLKIFIDHAIPGEKIQAEITEKKKNFGIGKLLKIQIESLERVEPICPIFKQCGGCQIMHLSYSKQLEFKKDKVQEALRKIGKIDTAVLPCLPSPTPLSYRNKIQLPFFESDGRLTLGLYQQKSHDPQEISECFIHCELGEKVFKQAKELFQNSSFKAYDEKEKTGQLRHLLIKTAIFNQECLVVIIASTKDKQKELKAIADELIKRCPEVKGVILNLNQKRFNSIMGDDYITLSGRAHIYEKLLGKTFKISAHSFFQVNPMQAEKLYSKALEFADLQKDQVALDAYCGTGTLSILAAKNARKVIGIENIKSAVDDASENAKTNQITNCEFILGNVEDKIDQIKKADVVFLNPPRKGCELSVIKAINILKPQRIVYVSCDPATLARDLAHLKEFGYTVKQVQPFDMFPQTTHVETCALLTL